MSLYSLIVGGIAGWLASNFMKGKGMGVVMNVILGIIGALVGALAFKLLGIGVTGDSTLGVIIQSTCGAAIVLFLARVLAK